MKNKIKNFRLKPAAVIVLGIAIIVIVGAFLLNLPVASKNMESIGFIDALFTATSSVSLTGLIVVNTAEHWTIFGKIVIIVLIQIGGLGFMTLATTVAIILGKKIGLRDRLIIQEELNQINLSGLVKLVRYVFLATVVIESIGAIILSIDFIPRYGIGKGIVFSIFHSISAFCNAGFDIIGNSLVDYTKNPLVTLTISALIIIGGLGYTVYIDLTKHRHYRRLSTHTKLVLKINTLLLIVGFIFIFLIEFGNSKTFGGFSLGEKVLASIFQAVSPRTAGFNSVDMGLIRPATAFIMIMLMFIGGSPSSTAGGIKTTTFGVILFIFTSTIRGKVDVEISGKRIPSMILHRALSIVIASLALVIVDILILTLTENQEFLDIVFEVVSAFGTVGVTRGITPELTTVGKMLIAATMFIGKVGPLTLVLALAKRQRKCEPKYRFPEDKIIVG